jgi:glycyl-tRNA synthetase alpha subunit
MCFRDNPSTPLEALVSMVGYRGEERLDGYVKSGRRPQSCRYGRFSQNPPCEVYPAGDDLKLAPRNHVALLTEVVLLVVDVERHPPRWICST